MTTTTNMSWRVAVADTVGFALEMFPDAGGGMGLDALLSDHDGDGFMPEINNVPGNYILCAAGRPWASLGAVVLPARYSCPVCFPSLRLCRFVRRAWDKEYDTPREYPAMPSWEDHNDNALNYKPFWA